MAGFASGLCYICAYLASFYIHFQIFTEGDCVSEILRVMRRLSMKEQWMDTSLQYLTLRALRSALSDNPRGQNHFRSIGGLEVLLDGLGLHSNSVLRAKNAYFLDKER